MASTVVAQRSIEVRQRILEAAAEVFAEHGFAGAGVDEIAHRARVNKAMLYYHVGDKATLFGAVTLAFVECVKTELAAAVSTSDEPCERLSAVPLAFARVARERPHFPQIMMREIAAGGAHIPADLLREITGIVHYTRQVVEDGAARGVFRDVNPLLVHLMLLGSMLFIANAVRMRPRMEELGAIPRDTPGELPEAARLIADVVLHGIVRRRPRGGKR